MFIYIQEINTESHRNIKNIAQDTHQTHENTLFVWKCARITKKTNIFPKMLGSKFSAFDADLYSIIKIFEGHTA